VTSLREKSITWTQHFFTLLGVVCWGMLCIWATDTTNNSQRRCNTKAGLTCASSFPEGSEGMWWGYQVLGDEWGHDENNREVGIVAVEVQVCATQTHGKSRFTHSTDHIKKIFMFFMFTPFGERHVTSIKIIRQVSKRPVSESLCCEKEDLISYHSGPDSQLVWMGRINLKWTELCWLNANWPTVPGC